MSSSYRQAVVVVHGMGEQSPMDMSRYLADVAIPDPPPGSSEPKFYSRPDKVSPSNQYDLRRLLAPRDGERLQTEFYEYHWAHLMSGNKVSDVLPLLKSLYLKVGPGKLGRLRSVWIAMTVIGLILAGLILMGVFVAGRKVETWDFASVIAVIGISGLWATIVTWLFKWPTRFATGWLADAARYWHPAPKNQDVRNKIRSGLVDLLEALHDSGRYGRVIIAAHSLGSVIAYDAIGYSWARYNKLHAAFKVDASPGSENTPIESLKQLWEQYAERPRTVVSPVYDALARFEDVAFRLNEAAVDMCDETGEEAPGLDGLRAEYRLVQRELWREMRCNGNPWLITDFVTFGSPLAHASVLIADGPDDLSGLIRRKEWPTIPPRPDRESVPGKFHWECEGDAKLLYHAAVFGPTRWTNLWYPKDSFGGPIDCRLGPGVENVELRGDGGGSKWWLVAHTHYLKHADRDAPGGATASLRTALDLDAKSWMPKCVTSTGDPPKHDPESAKHTSKPSQRDKPDHDPEE